MNASEALEHFLEQAGDIIKGTRLKVVHLEVGGVDHQAQVLGKVQGPTGELTKVGRFADLKGRRLKGWPPDMLLSENDLETRGK